MKNLEKNDKNNKKDDNMDINSIDTRLEQLRLMQDTYRTIGKTTYTTTDTSRALEGKMIVSELSTKIRSASVADMPSIIACCDKILQKSLSDRGNLFQITVSLDLTTMRCIEFLEALLEKKEQLAVYNILVHQGSDNKAKPVGYQLAHGRYRDDFFEKIINKLPEDLAKNLRNAAFVIYLDEARTEAVEYDLLGDGVRYLL